MSTQYKESTGLKAHKGDMRGLYIILGIVVLTIFMVIGSIVGNASPVLKPLNYYRNFPDQSSICQVIAKDIRSEYGGYTVHLDDGNWSHVGHEINALIFNNKTYYIDYGWGKIFYSKENLQERLWEYELNYTRITEIHYLDDSMKVVV